MINVVTIGQFVPGDSLLHRLDPRTKIICVIATAIAVFVVVKWYEFVLLSGFVFLSMILTGIPARLFLKGLFSIWLLLVVTFLLQALLTPGEVLFGLGFLKVTREGLMGGGQIFVRLALLILIAFLLTLTTSPVNLTAGLESILAPLKRVGVPTHELAMMMTIALRFVPTLLNEADKVTKAQRSRGAGFSSGGTMSRVKGLLPLFVPLIAGALRSAEELAVAMESRCYRGGANRTRMKSMALGVPDYVTMSITFAVLALSVWLRYT
ncbi:energy-coupling factor transporter transmembrane protein EcfT [Pelotomaculum isophthalicicum JI]|uniref:Energy-coupling factor transporter transmembrane protein EcfT n=1 Tax=Pelotomaculum isophthalicicum JI TaxID=947010 RepID=A0A9X4JVK2_9FIRM|nr:energy-coupling factor transporter transmembrane component T [Pelotomaculum isophthalicicum]MDF9407573.1 energy-coupling factor transporter transmembrane protein EcfT [Pelotomaculum isophthalicicum JI]